MCLLYPGRPRPVCEYPAQGYPGYKAPMFYIGERCMKTCIHVQKKFTEGGWLVFIKCNYLPGFFAVGDAVL